MKDCGEFDETKIVELGGEEDAVGTWGRGGISLGHGVHGGIDFLIGIDGEKFSVGELVCDGLVKRGEEEVTKERVLRVEKNIVCVESTDVLGCSKERNTKGVGDGIAMGLLRVNGRR